MDNDDDDDDDEDAHPFDDGPTEKMEAGAQEKRIFYPCLCTGVLRETPGLG